VYHFTPPGASEIQDRLEEVARIEDADVDPQLIQDIAIECNGDVRNALRALERKVKVAESRQSDRADKVSDFIGGE
jgi:replication-associated recombination protein RarA